MSKQPITSIDQGLEPLNNYCTLTDGVPDPSLITWALMEIFWASVNHDGHEPMLAANEVAAGGGEMLPPEYVTVVDAGGSPVEMLRGTISFGMQVRGIGDGGVFADYDAHPLARILDTSMVRGPAPGQASDVVAAAGLDATQFEPTTVGAFSVGNLVSARINGRLETRLVVAVTAGPTPNVVVSPAFSRIVTNADTMYLHQGWHAPKAGEFGIQPTRPMAFRFRADDGHTWAAFGCRLQEITFSEDGGRLIANVVMRSPWIRRIDAVAPAPGTFVNGSMRTAAPLAAPMVISNTPVVPGAPGVGLAPAYLQPQGGVTTRYAPELQEIQDPGHPCGYAELGVGNYEASIQAQFNRSPIIAGMLLGQEDRTVIAAYGPDLPGCGFAAAMPAAHLEAEALEQFDGSFVTHEATFMPGFDQIDSVATGSGQSGFRLFLRL